MQRQQVNSGQSRLDILLKKKIPTKKEQQADARNTRRSAEGQAAILEACNPTHWEPGEQKLRSWIKQNINYLPSWKKYFETH